MSTMLRALAVAGALILAGGAANAAAFAKADASHDGLVTYAEAKRVMPQLTEVSFNKFATDGVVTKGAWPGLSNFYDLMYRQR